MAVVSFLRLLAANSHSVSLDAKHPGLLLRGVIAIIGAEKAAPDHCEAAVGVVFVVKALGAAPG